MHPDYLRGSTFGDAVWTSIFVLFDKNEIKPFMLSIVLGE